MIRLTRERRWADASLRAITAEVAQAGHKMFHEGVKKVVAGTPPTVPSGSLERAGGSDVPRPR